ncbi:MAG TPA: glycosyltransferase family 1 protein [Candidatus Brocadiia bacterium]|nr:glycosyltransferase family 1 protein [Candidatus Brocadiia bacterium]
MPGGACQPLRVGLVSTAPEDGVGSMSLYARLVSLALDRAAGVEAAPIRLATGPRFLRPGPKALGGRLGHVSKAIGAVRSFFGPRVDLYHILDGSHAYVAPLLPRKPLVVTCHDLIPLLQLEGRLGGAPPSRLGAWLVRRSAAALRRAHAVVAVSERSRRDAAEVAGAPVARLAVAHNPAPPRLVEWAAAQGRLAWPQRRQAEPYVLHVGNDAFYKNRPVVLRVFARLAAAPELRLKMAGAPPEDGLRGLCAGLGVAGRVDFIPSPSEEQLWRLYRGAALFLFPSLYEGFGWPPLEAMLLDCPVVCSNAASLPEVAGGAALMAAPDDVDALARLCRRVLDDAGVAGALIEAGRRQAARFTMERFAAGLLAAYEMALGRPRGSLGGAVEAVA